MLPFHCTVELEMKLLPLTVSVKALPPTVVDAGEVELTVGTGLGGGCEFDPPDEEPPPHPAVLASTSRQIVCARSDLRTVRVRILDFIFRPRLPYDSASNK